MTDWERWRVARVSELRRQLSSMPPPPGPRPTGRPTTPLEVGLQMAVEILQRRASLKSLRNGGALSLRELSRRTRLTRARVRSVVLFGCGLGKLERDHRGGSAGALIRATPPRRGGSDAA